MHLCDAVVTQVIITNIKRGIKKREGLDARQAVDDTAREQVDFYNQLGSNEPSAIHFVGWR